MKPRVGAVRPWLLFLAAPLVWFAHFSALYGIASFVGLSNTVAWTVTCLACLAVAAVWFAARRAPGGMTAWLAALSLAGILFQTLPLALMPL